VTCRRIVSVIGLLSLLVITAVGCNNGPTEPDDGVQKTKNFSGTLNPGETKAFNFTVESPGQINVSITSLSQGSSLTMGLRIGAWDAGAGTCPEQVFSNSARVNLVLSGKPQGPGQYCVAIYDVGNLQDATDFNLSVTHF
jgi:hypothetical protein